MLPKYKIHGQDPKVLFILLRILQFIVSLPSPVLPDLFGLPFPEFSTQYNTELAGGKENCKSRERNLPMQYQ